MLIFQITRNKADQATFLKFKALFFSTHFAFFLIIRLFHEALNIEPCIKTSLINHELEVTWKKETVVLFQILV